MNVYHILLIASILFPLASFFPKRPLFSHLLLDAGLLLFIGLTVGGVIFSFSYTSILTLVYGTLILLADLLYAFLSHKGLPIEIVCGVLGSIAFLATLPAEVIYAAQSDYYMTFLYISIFLAGGLSALYLIFLSKEFKSARIPSKITGVAFSFLGLASLLFCLFNLFQSRYLLFYFFSVFFLLLSAIFKKEVRIAGLFRYFGFVGATVFVIAPLIF